MSTDISVTGEGSLASNSLDHWLEVISAVHPREMELGLERVAQVYALMGLGAYYHASSSSDSLSNGCCVITVAGTNGKGSCVASMERLLVSQSVSCGAFTSPHLHRFNERIRINGAVIDDASLCDAFATIDRARGDIPLTYFEFSTLAALWIFAEAKVDYALLEVGLGGRLDAVNIVDADIAVLTSVDLDHQQWLGSDIEVIAGEKLGIARSGRPLIVGEPRNLAAIADCERSLGIQAQHLGRDFQCDDARFQWPARGIDYVLPDHELVKTSVACAIAALQETAFASQLSAAIPALSGGALVGRFQREQLGGVELILDVAHNPAAAALLAQKLASLPKAGRCVSLFAVMADKDVANIVAPLKGLSDAWFLAPLSDCDRALTPKDAAQALADAGEHMISVSKNIKQAYRRALSLLEAGDRLLVWGSFFTVAEVLPLIAKDQQRIARQEDSGQ